MDLTYVLVNATIARCRASTARNVTLLLVICTDLAILISNLSSVLYSRHHFKKINEISSKRQQLNYCPSQDIQQTRDTREKPVSFHTRENIRQNIINLYGEGIYHNTRTFEKLWTKKTR